MKIKIIICVLLAFQFGVHAQETKKKPSWTDTMPERKDAPGMKMQIEKEDGFGLDRSSLGFDRDEMSSTEDTTPEPVTQQMTNKIEIQKKLDNERKKNSAQLAKIKKLEAEKLAQKNQAEQERIAAQERIAEQERIAAQKIAEQKLAQERIAAQKKAEQEKTQQESKQKKIVKQDSKVNLASNSSYKWKKVKNVAPVYPPKAARKKTEGWVDIEITIDSTGKVTDARVLRSKRNTHIFDNSALKAVKKWKYEPPSNYGINTKLRKSIRMVYQL